MAVALNKNVRQFIDEHLTTEMRVNGALDLEKFAKKVGVSNIYLADFNKPNVSGLLKKEGDVWNIYVNHKDSPRRRRFTIAHELGHFISYRSGSESKAALDEKGQVSDLAFTRTVSHANKMEEEANSIAAHILMPEGDVRDLLEKGKITEELAQYFQVSESAMLVRLNALGITPFETYGRRGGVAND